MEHLFACSLDPILADISSNHCLANSENCAHVLDILAERDFFFGKIAERDWLSSFNSLDPFFFPGLMHWFLACMNLLTALASYTNCLILLVQNSDS